MANSPGGLGGGASSSPTGDEVHMRATPAKIKNNNIVTGQLQRGSAVLRRGFDRRQMGPAAAPEIPRSHRRGSGAARCRHE